ncbi:MAG: Phosphodiesterase/alkaline phosphatase D [uncultured Rubrobacteraceae bacterium]|uniref:Phosphodiesterase/alkaline phosphatase D n=1 Tax=uncultured Rubrobacteraceae bacterium TaxID=349277 RepID=A0A6J4QBL7_9ACTN|nr:MAG: Phosphodiesterase/alkaline phosphatase D [uncultured Rubrobacteraceae bacterium]
MDRRTFVKLTGLSAAALVFGTEPFARNVPNQHRFSDYPFSLGVASGDPAPDGVVLWTRLAPDPLNGGGLPDREIPVRWQVASDENFRQIVRHGTGLARSELAHSMHVEVGGLEPAREYFYRFMAGPEQSTTGRTKTAPAAGASVSGLTFAFASCQQYEHGYFTAYRRMSEEDLDLVVHLGDYIYEYGPGEDDAPDGNVRAHDRRVSTLQDFRDRYALYRMDEDLQAAHAAFPWIVTPDDHEVENNYADEFPETGPASPDFVQRRAAAYQAYYEHMPLRRSSMPRGPEMPVYRRLTYGDLLEFNVLDTRQYRDDQASGDGRRTPGPESRDPNRTLMGAKQERWLLDGLAASNARWNILAQQVFFAQYDNQGGDGRQFEMDAWDGYAPCRDRIVDFVSERDVENLVVLTGNVHGNWANEILADFDDPDSPSVGVELVGTSITSGGDGSDVWPGADTVMAENPHVKFSNNQRGYARCRLTPDAWQTDYRVLPFVKEPGAPIATRASYMVENGYPRLQAASG